MQQRMGDLQLGRVKDHIIVKEDIKVDDPWPPADHVSPTHVFFNILEDDKKLRGHKGCLCLNCHIDKAGLISNSPGFRLDHRGLFDDLHPPEAKLPDRFPAVLLPVADVGTNADMNNGHTDIVTSG